MCTKFTYQQEQELGHNSLIKIQSLWSSSREKFLQAGIFRNVVFVEKLHKVAKKLSVREPFYPSMEYYFNYQGALTN